MKTLFKLFRVLPLLLIVACGSDNRVGNNPGGGGLGGGGFGGGGFGSGSFAVNSSYINQVRSQLNCPEGYAVGAFQGQSSSYNPSQVVISSFQGFQEAPQRSFIGVVRNQAIGRDEYILVTKLQSGTRYIVEIGLCMVSGVNQGSLTASQGQGVAFLNMSGEDAVNQAQMQFNFRHNNGNLYNLFYYFQHPGIF